MSKKNKLRLSPESLSLPCVGIETHAHLDLRDYDRDLDLVLDRALACGVARIGNVFLGPDAYLENAGRFAGQERVFFILGVHPHDAKTCDANTLPTMQAAFARDGRIKALGEIGLDFFRDHSPRDVQRRIFRDQLALAKGLSAPVVIHSRDAHQEAVRILLDQGFKDRPVLWHCFGGDREFAKQLLDLGWFLSVPGTVTYSKNLGLQEAVAHVPLERMVLETDCPFLTPEPYRGRRNEPAYMVFTAARVAEIKHIPVEEVWRRCADTAKGFFRL